MTTAIGVFFKVFFVVVAIGIAMAAIMGFWMKFWPEMAFIGSLTTLSAFAFGGIAAMITLYDQAETETEEKK